MMSSWSKACSVLDLTQRTKCFLGHNLRRMIHKYSYCTSTENYFERLNKGCLKINKQNRFMWILSWFKLEGWNILFLQDYEWNLRIRCTLIITISICVFLYLIHWRMNSFTILLFAWGKQRGKPQWRFCRCYIDYKE